jgi:hypothetical protein
LRLQDGVQAGRVLSLVYLYRSYGEGAWAVDGHCHRPPQPVKS